MPGELHDMPKIREDASDRIDDYIEKARDFARPICTRLRELIHEADPEILEDWKWGPNFHREGMLCGIGAFKQHVSLHFFKGALMKDGKRLFRDAGDAKGSRSMSFASVEEIDPTAIRSYVREAVRLNLAGEKVKLRKPPVRPPADLRRALAENPDAAGNFRRLAPGYRREYVEWITGAKRPATRAKRVAETVAKCSRGESLHEKYRQGC